MRETRCGKRDAYLISIYGSQYRFIFFTHFLESFFIDKIQWWSKMTTTENLVVILVVISGQSGLVKSGVLLEQF